MRVERVMFQESESFLCNIKNVSIGYSKSEKYTRKVYFNYVCGDWLMINNNYDKCV